MPAADAHAHAACQIGAESFEARQELLVKVAPFGGVVIMQINVHRGHHEPRLIGLFPRHHGGWCIERGAARLQELAHRGALLEGKSSRPLAQAPADLGRGGGHNEW